MKTHIRKYYERLYCGKQGKRPPIFSGKTLAAELGYPPSLVEAIPAELWEDFLPCGNPLPFVNPMPEDMVLNLGCGTGVDSIALMIAGKNLFKAVNLDIVCPVLHKASKVARRIFPDRDLHWICGDGEALPFISGSFRWAILNGVLNLLTDKGKLAEGLSRVLKEGGIVAGADLFRTAPLPDYFRDEPDAWAWCMSGALTEEELIALFRSAGFKKVKFMPEKMDEYFDRALFVFEKKRPF